jgi:nickel/cobalt exporter
MLEESLQSGSVVALAWTALALGFIHTVLGPDHYVPFVAMAASEGWSRAKTMVITAVCGLGHVVGSVLIAAALIALGTALEGWEGHGLASFHELRGDVAAWALMGVGAAYGLWGLRRASRGKVHSHSHHHADGEVHSHEHDHHGQGGHLHVHGRTIARLTPWVLFTIFVFGPCESLIPLGLASWALAGMGAFLLVASAFTLSTVATILVLVLLLQGGLQLLPLKSLERWTHALAGLSLLACGAAIRFLGL